MKILFLAHFFPPFSIVGAIRTGKTAKYLTQFGHDVRVISRKDQPLERTLDLEIPEDKVIYTSWLDVNYGREFLGRFAKKSTSTARPSHRPKKPTLKNRVGKLYRNLFHFPDKEIGWFPFAVTAANRVIRNWRPDLILASSSPKTALLAASWLSKKHGIPWVGDLRDLWLENPLLDLAPWRLGLERRLEKKVLASAAGLVSVSDSFSDILYEKTRKPTQTVTNGFEPHAFSAGAKQTGDGKVHIAHFGGMYQWRRDPSPLFQALNRLGGDAEKIRLHFYGPDLDIVRQTAVRYEVNHLVETHAPVSHQESMRLQQQADVLLLLRLSQKTDETTSKVFEYLGSRRPILLLGGPESQLAKRINAREAGAVLNDPEEIANQLKIWIRQKTQDGIIPPIKEGASKGLTRKEQTQKLEKFLEKIIEAGKSA